MRIRPGTLAPVLCLALAAACNPGEEPADETAQDTAGAQEAMNELASWGPVKVSCRAIADHVEGKSEEYTVPDDATTPVVIELKVDSAGELMADPPKPVVHRGQALQFRSDTLEAWKVAFIPTGMTPHPQHPGPIESPGKGQSAPPTADAGVDADCGRYYYVAMAEHPETGALLFLEPPVMVRN